MKVVFDTNILSLVPPFTFHLLPFSFPLLFTQHLALGTEHSALFYLSDAASFVASTMTVLERTKSGSDAQRPVKA
jgi:hypothetical protein